MLARCPGAKAPKRTPLVRPVPRPQRGRPAEDGGAMIAVIPAPAHQAVESHTGFSRTGSRAGSSRGGLRMASRNLKLARRALEDARRESRRHRAGDRRHRRDERQLERAALQALQEVSLGDSDPGREAATSTRSSATGSGCSRCRRGSLGRTICEWFIREDISAEGLAGASEAAAEQFPDRPVNRGRRGEGLRVALLLNLHDVFHVLTGYDRDMRGEIAVLAFTVPQTWNTGIAYLVWRSFTEKRLELRSPAG